jgi:hypothetical protein
MRHFWYVWSRVIIEEQNITMEKMHVERLLYSLLPRRIADRIIHIRKVNKKFLLFRSYHGNQDPSSPQIIADDEPNATVMFARICGFDVTSYLIMN